MKISIIGAGNVGSTLAERVLTLGVGDVVLLDILGDFARAKAYDLMDARSIMGYKKSIVGSSEYKDIADSGIVVITAGLPRRPGMSRDDLIGKNHVILNSVLSGVKEFSPESIIVVVTNPLDIMTYIAYGKMNGDRKKVLGMAGNLDGARFNALLSQEFSVKPEKIETFVLGSHGDTMVPIVSKTFIDGKPLKSLLDEKRLKNILERTKKRGEEIVGLLKSGSAYFSPSAAVLEIIRAIVNDEKKIISCSCVLDGEYGIKDCAIGVPAVLGALGVEEIPIWDLQDDELKALKESAGEVKRYFDCIQKGNV